MSALPNPFLDLPALPRLVSGKGLLTDDAPPASVRRPSFLNEDRFVLDVDAFMAAIAPAAPARAANDVLGSFLSKGAGT